MSKILGGSVRFDFKKFDSFTLETSKTHLIHNFLRNGRVRVKTELQKIWTQETDYCLESCEVEI